jgi:hypothetical protein
MSRRRLGHSADHRRACLSRLTRDGLQELTELKSGETSADDLSYTSYEIVVRSLRPVLNLHCCRLGYRSLNSRTVQNGCSLKGPPTRYRSRSRCRIRRICRKERIGAALINASGMSVLGCAFQFYSSSSVNALCGQQIQISRCRGLALPAGRPGAADAAPVRPPSDLPLLCLQFIVCPRAEMLLSVQEKETRISRWLPTLARAVPVALQTIPATTTNISIAKVFQQTNCFRSCKISQNKRAYNKVPAHTPVSWQDGWWSYICRESGCESDCSTVGTPSFGPINPE